MKKYFPLTLHFLSLENITLNVVASVKSSPSSKSFASVMLQQWVPLGVSTSSFVLPLKILSFLWKKNICICVCVYIHIYRFKRVFNLRQWFKKNEKSRMDSFCFTFTKKLILENVIQKDESFEKLLEFLLEAGCYTQRTKQE